jgi:hypothetical protein
MQSNGAGGLTKFAAVAAGGRRIEPSWQAAALHAFSGVAILLALGAAAAAESVPLPRPRPAQIVSGNGSPKEAETAASACRLRLNGGWAVAAPAEIPPGPGECGVEDAVRLEAVLLADRARVAVSPPAILRCSFAEAIAHWLREDVAPAIHVLDAGLGGIDDYASYDCRGRNRVVGAKVSEHGKGNALDIRSLKLSNGTVLGLTDPKVPRQFREMVRASACARFTTVLGPGSDGYHEDHVHVDLAERHSGYRICQWDVLEPAEDAPEAAAAVPLPRPRPAAPRGR